MITRSNKSRLLRCVGLVVALATGVLISASLANAQVSFSVLHTFAGYPTDGAIPYAGLIQGPDGTLYGTTYIGGTLGYGTVFRMAADGSSYSVLHSFGAAGDGADPYAGLIQGPDGTLYGTTESGGSSNRGTIFQIAPDGSGYTVLHRLTSDGTEGASPFAGLIQGPDGTLYGTTTAGGASNGGTIFQIAPDGSGYAVLHSFTLGATDGDGYWPYAGLIQGPDGTLYGTTQYGGTRDYGTIFQIAPDGSGYAVLHNFGDVGDGAYPRAGLIQGSDGTLYGTTQNGGTSGNGTVFQMAPDSSGFTILHSFSLGGDGVNPQAGLIQGPDGTLYGTTQNGGAAANGTIFQVAPDGNGYSILHSFAGADGANPYAGLIQGLDGTLYGTTYYGGTSGGVAFQLTLPSSTPKGSRAGHK